MAVVCGDCQTENRDGARFCKGCGRKLARVSTSAATAGGDGAGWPDTQRMPLPIPVAPPGIFDPEWMAPRASAARDDATAIVTPLRRPSPPLAPTSSPQRSPLPLQARRAPARATSRAMADDEEGSRTVSRAPWRVLGVIVALVVVGGGLYLYSAGDPDLSPAVAVPMPMPALAPAPPIVPAAEVQPAAPSPRAIEQRVESPPPSPSAPAEAAVAKPRPVLAQKPRKPAPAAPVAPPPVAAVVVPPPAPVVPPPPAEPPNPQTACADLNFFARARCMATQCAKADFKASPQCEAVHRQQQIDEEKRNPTMAG
jgi:hypothetical protein